MDEMRSCPVARIPWSINGTFRTPRQNRRRARRSRAIDKPRWDRTHGVDVVKGHQEEEEERRVCIATEEYNY